MRLELVHLGRWVEVAELQESSELLLFLPNLGKMLSTSGLLSNLGGLGDDNDDDGDDDDGDDDADGGDDHLLAISQS